MSITERERDDLKMVIVIDDKIAASENIHSSSPTSLPPLCLMYVEFDP